PLAKLRTRAMRQPSAAAALRGVERPRAKPLLFGRLLAAGHWRPLSGAKCRRLQLSRFFRRKMTGGARPGG
ncbi:MAG TPA: hypothetical protein VM662_00640, partial [Sphingomonas sp.]|nr:hypothetical protein [Sphingomonas sp.]